jgi:hypothetical protein
MFVQMDYVIGPTGIQGIQGPAGEIGVSGSMPTQTFFYLNNSDSLTGPTTIVADTNDPLRSYGIASFVYDPTSGLLTNTSLNTLTIMVYYNIQTTPVSQWYYSNILDGANPTHILDNFLPSNTGLYVSHTATVVIQPGSSFFIQINLNPVAPTYTVQANSFVTFVEMDYIIGPTGPIGRTGALPTQTYYLGSNVTIQNGSEPYLIPNILDTSKSYGNFSANYNNATGILSNPTTNTLLILIHYNINPSDIGQWFYSNIIDNTTKTILDNFAPSNTGYGTGTRVSHSATISLAPGQSIAIVFSQSPDTPDGTYFLRPNTTFIRFCQLDYIFIVKSLIFFPTTSII